MRTEYGFAMDIGMSGQLADSSHKVTDSFAAESVVLPGRAVTRGTDPSLQVKAITADTDAFAGIAMLSMAIENPAGGGAVTYAPEDVVPVMTFGRIIVDVVGPVTAGQPVYVIATGVDAGKFSATETGNIEVPRSMFKTNTEEDGLAVVELR